jgi:CO dehydrogenase/acetyl-CoA synthase beta subunit
MLTRKVIHLEKETEFLFHNEYPALENLITVVLMEEYKISNRLDAPKNIVEKIKTDAREGKVTIAYGGWCAFK